jgi:DNA invertase Pin-like site-specific DNA recombinase
MAKQKAVAYYRVSTAKQGASGLGLEAQQEAVRSYCSTGKWTMVDEVTEIESGKKNDRPALATALALCRVHGATLIIAKLDRLARNVHFISGLMESGVEFTAVDFPQANRLTVHILAAVAEHEAVLISQRTKAALAAAKARGVRLGNPTARIASQAARGALASAVVRSRAAQSRAADLRPILAAERAAAMSQGRPGGLRAIAAHLNDRGIPGPRGGRWHGNSVRRVLKRQRG